MAVEFEITKIVTVTLKDGTIERIVFDMTSTETDDKTGDRIVQAVVDAAIENPPAGDVRDIIVAYAKENNWKQQLLDRLDAKKAVAEKTVEFADLTKIAVVVDEKDL